MIVSAVVVVVDVADAAVDDNTFDDDTATVAVVTDTSFTDRATLFTAVVTTDFLPDESTHGLVREFTGLNLLETLGSRSLDFGRLRCSMSAGLSFPLKSNKCPLPLR